MLNNSTRPCNNYPQFELIHLNNSLHKFDIQFIKLYREEMITKLESASARAVSICAYYQTQHNPFDIISFYMGGAWIFDSDGVALTLYAHSSCK